MSEPVKPEGKPPTAYQKCPLCHAAPGEAHTAECAWRKWAESKP